MRTHALPRNRPDFKQYPQRHRGDGTTTRQMLAALQGSIYVWCNGDVGPRSYPAALAMKLRRGDLKIVSPDWILDQRWLGIHFPGIMVDHAVTELPLTRDRIHDFYACLQRARMNIRNDNVRC